MFKNALVSVSDKSGLLEFMKPLAQQGMRIVSTGGTAQFLREHGLRVIDVSEQTRFPEVMGGRVKTLHPNIHMGLLARQNVPDDFAVLKKYGVEPFDLVVCNLYPFENTVTSGKPLDEQVENIDIGGPSMLRGSAKNFERVAVICDPTDYPEILQKKSLSLQDRQKLAAKVFAHTAAYDSLIAQTLGPGWGKELAFGGRKMMDLRYGENPQQAAGWYRFLGQGGPGDGLQHAEILQGKPLSYNNLLDLDAAVLLATQFKEPTAVAVKHNNPCGVGTGDNPLKKALSADPVSVFGGVIACNFTIGVESAEFLNSVFLECIIAPAFTKEAIEMLARKKNVRVLFWEHMDRAKKTIELRTVYGGFLIQDADQLGSDEKDWKYLGSKPTPEMMKDLVFAEKVCASLKSNAISIVKDGQTLGLGMGQVNRVDAVAHALERMKSHHPGKTNAVLASDAFFPFPDSIQKAAAAGIQWVLQPGGSVKDEEVFAAARALNVNMIITGKRHFRH